MDFVYIDDVAKANVLAPQSDRDDDGSTWRAVARPRCASSRRAAEGDGRHAPGARIRPERSVNPVLRRLASTRKAQSLLGFRAEVGLEEGLDRLVRWWQKCRPLEVTA
jgi:UDP-glucose 4-epimerase